MSRRKMLGLTAAAATSFCWNRLNAAPLNQPDPKTNEDIKIGTGAGAMLTFERRGLQLSLQQIQRHSQPPILYRDSAMQASGAGAVGNPLTLVILTGPQQGTYGMETFELTQLDHSPARLLAYLKNTRLPMQIGLEITVEGDVIEWRGQAVWNGPDDVDVDIYYPILSRVRFDPLGGDRLISGELSGVEKSHVAKLNYSATYLGGLASPVFMVEGGGRGLAFIEDSRADFAADPGACRQRSAVVGTKFPLPDDGDAAHDLTAGEDGPFMGWRHRRLLLGAKRFGGQADYDQAESHGTLPLIKIGDSVDLGPVLSYAYAGTWKTAALWMRQQRQWIPFRSSPAKWYRDTTMLSEEMPDTLLRTGKSLYDLPILLEDRHQLGSDMMSIPGFAEPEILGTDENMLNRGDYFYPAENLGGWEAMRRGVEATHRQGGHVLLYVEGLIVWKRSRIGRSKAADWALMDANGKYTVNYNGFYDMCPAETGWQDWFARTLADVVRTTGVDGFFMDSMLATDNHRCFNPKHAHSPQPDIWNWGLRRVLQRVREEVDKADPNTILLCEGAGDLAREFTDGSLSHGHAWTRMTFTVPLARFLHPQMRAFEADGIQPHASDAPRWPVQKPLLWNAVQGYRVFMEVESHEVLGPQGRRVREYYDLYPEICDAQVSAADVLTTNCIAQWFDGLPSVITCGNDSDSARDVTLEFPAATQVALLFDRRDQKRVAVESGKAKFQMAPWEFRAFELRV
jgi:hypothetical protein